MMNTAARRRRARRITRRKAWVTGNRWYREYRDEVEDVFAVFDRVTAELDTKVE